MTTTTRTLIQVTKEDTKAIVYTLQDSSGNAIDITNYIIWFTVKNTPDESDADATIQVKNEVGDHSDPTNGQTTFNITSTQNNIDAGDYSYDIQMKDGSGNITTTVKGTYRVLEQITDSTS